MEEGSDFGYRLKAEAIRSADWLIRVVNERVVPRMMLNLFDLKQFKTRLFSLTGWKGHHP